MDNPKVGKFVGVLVIVAAGALMIILGAIALVDRFM